MEFVVGQPASRQPASVRTSRSADSRPFIWSGVTLRDLDGSLNPEAYLVCARPPTRQLRLCWIFSSVSAAIVAVILI